MTYAGFDVLDQTVHNGAQAISEAFDRHGAFVANPTGRKLWDDFAGQPQPRRTFLWSARGRAQIAALRAFLDARKGRTVPFWVPTYCHDLPLQQGALAAQSSLRIWKVGYGQYLYPLTARRYLAIVKPGGAFLIRKVTFLVDNGDGTETITLDSGLGEDLPQATTKPCFLVLCRLDESKTPITWYSVARADAQLTFREIPTEVPA